MRKSSSATSTASSSVPSLCSIPTSQQPPPEVMNSDLEIPEVTAQTPCGTVFNWEDLMQVNWNFKGIFAKYVIRIYILFFSVWWKTKPLNRLLMESCKSSALMAFMTFDQEGIFIICQMLWHETPIFAVLSEFCSFIQKNAQF